MTAFTFGLRIMYVHFTSLVLEQGTTKATAAYYLSIAGACNSASRILVGIATNSDNMNELLLYSGCFGILGTTALFIQLFINFVPGQIAFAVILGIYSGGCYPLLNSIVVKLVGIENLALAYGMELFAGGVGGVLGPVISGMLVDAGLTYAQSFMMAGGACLLGALFGFSVSCCDGGSASRQDGAETNTNKNYETDKNNDIIVNDTPSEFEIIEIDVSTHL